MGDAGDRFAQGPIELLGIEPLEEHARRLAALLTVSNRGRVSSRTHRKRLRQHARTHRQVYTLWLLDNFHIVVAALRDIRHDPD